MRREPTWHPHPMHRPGRYLAALTQLGIGAALLWAARTGTILPTDWRGDAAAGAILVFALATMLLARGPRALRMLGLVLVSLAATGMQLGLAWRAAHPPVGAVPAAALLLAGLVLLVIAERRRRRVRMRLATDHVLVSAPRWGLQHTLPLDAVREVNARRGAAGRVWGYGHFTARVRTGTMKDHTTRPVVAEPPPPDALAGCGWDEEERFHLVAAHPYGALGRLLEERVRVARLAPAERKETELASRLAEDLEGLQV